MEFLQAIADNCYKALIFQDRWKMLLRGLGNTILIAIGATILGVLIGIVLAIVKYSAEGNKGIVLRILDKIASLYITVIRGTPVMVQLFILSTAVLVFVREGVIIAIVGFGLNSGAYVAEIIRAGINAVDHGQSEAGRSLGLSKWQTMRHIILPQAIKNILPALGNEFIVLLKETSVAGYIAVEDLTFVAQRIKTVSYNPTVFFITAGVYLVMVIGLTAILRRIERRLARSDHR